MEATPSLSFGGAGVGGANPPKKDKTKNWPQYVLVLVGSSHLEFGNAKLIVAFVDLARANAILGFPDAWQYY